eukprot:GHVH01012049.1.p1 GENE.GHVH01012049.1~~GHVH01012049.1.p1  ORF type:complete len:1193 (+),score=188.10 GHVH01012049.1:52-3579(+)
MLTADEAEKFITSFVLGATEVDDTASVTFKTLEVIQKRNLLPAVISTSVPLRFKEADRILNDVTQLDHYTNGLRPPLCYWPAHEGDPFKDLQDDSKWTNATHAVEDCVRAWLRVTELNGSSPDVYVNAFIQKLDKDLGPLKGLVEDCVARRVGSLLHGPALGESWDSGMKTSGLLARSLMGLGSLPEMPVAIVEAIMVEFAKVKLGTNWTQADIDQAISLELRKLLLIIVNQCLRDHRSISSPQLKHLRVVHLIFHSKHVESILNKDKLPLGFWGTASKGAESKGAIASMLGGPKPEVKEVDGLRLEINSLLSVLMPPSPIDQVYCENHKMTAYSTQQRMYHQVTGNLDKWEYFERYNGRRSFKWDHFQVETGNAVNINASDVMKKMRPGALEQMTKNASINLDCATNIAASAIKTLCKIPALKDIVLQWFSDFLQSSEFRSTLKGEQMERYLYTFNPDGAFEENNKIQAERSQCMLESLPTMAKGYSVMCVLLRLIKPIKLERTEIIDTEMMTRYESIDEDTVKGPAATIVGKRLLISGSRLAQGHLVDIKHRSKPEGSIREVKFGAGVYWLALRAVASIFRPLVSRHKLVTQGVEEARQAFGYTSPFFAERFAEYAVYLTALTAPSLSDDYCHLLSLSQKIFLEMAHDSALYSSRIPRRDSLLWAMPVDIMKGLIDPLTTYMNVAEQSSIVGNTLNAIQFEPLISLLMTLINCCTELTDPADLLAPVFRLMFGALKTDDRPSKNDWASYFCKALMSSSIVQQDMFPSLMRCFVYAQKSDYHTRIQVRYEYIHLIEEIFNLDPSNGPFENSFIQYTHADSPNFRQFMHHFTMELTNNIEEGLNYIAEIKARNDQGETEEQARSQQRAKQARRVQRAQDRARDGNADDENEDSDSDSDGDDARQALMDTEYRPSVTAMNFVRLTDMCRSFNRATNSSLRVFNTIIHLVPQEIAGMDTQLLEVILALNCSLDLLAGPKCSSLKVKDFTSYHFQPLDNLTMVVNAYLDLALDETAHDDLEDCIMEEIKLGDCRIRETVVRAILREERYYRIENFTKALTVMEKKRSISSAHLSKLRLLIDALNSLQHDEERKRKKLETLTIPDAYLDPIMGELMTSPVKLPDSGNIMDMCVIERHLMNDGHDPFTRQPLAISEVIPQEDLKNEIRQWMIESELLDGN